jgi:prepilin-type processing-associated H-X9-DG protein
VAVDYERPVGPWLAVVGTYAMVAGLVALLGYTAKRAMDARGTVPRAEHPKLARELEEEKGRKLPHSPGGLADLLRDYVKDPRVLLCATAELKMRESWWPARERPEEDASYCYVSGLSQREPTGWPLAFDEEWNHEGHGVNVLYIGGHVRWVRDPSAPGAEFAEVAQTMAKRGKPLRLSRPWWSRAPERPAFMPPPKADADPGISKAYVVVAAIVFALGAFFLGRYARRSA